MSKHTPGPWSYRTEPRSLADSGSYIVGSNGDEPAYICPLNLTPGAREANAALIAAAPEMLEALEAIFQARAPQLNFDFEGHPDMQLLVAAIKKAKGES